jgi:transcription initiation factor TFIIIB Brf1 subunit/transcription initiation factor TFIIB
MEFKCPTCQSIIYSRKQKVCGQCGAALPPELRLTDAQIRFFEEEQKKADKRARESGIQVDPSGPSFDVYL